MTDSLLSRLQSATGPSRELDAEIALANGWTYEKRHSGRPRGGDAHPYWRKPGVTDWYMREANGPPRYTESIDAGLTLVPDGYGWAIEARAKSISDGHRVFIAWVSAVGSEKEPAIPSIGTTPALALLIAIERAKEDSK